MDKPMTTEELRAWCEKAVDIKDAMVLHKGHCFGTMRVLDMARAVLALIAERDRLAMIVSGGNSDTHGCFVDDYDGADCVLDDADDNVASCGIASMLQQNGLGRNDCKYWRPLDVAEISDTALTARECQTCHLPQYPRACRCEVEELVITIRSLIEHGNIAVLDEAGCSTAEYNYWVHAASVAESLLRKRGDDE